MMAGLGAGLTGPKMLYVQSAPVSAPLAQAASHLVISEFRTRGPANASDEFIEIYNPTGSAVLLTGWKIRKSSGCGGVLTDLVTIGAVNLAPGQHYLIGNSPNYTGPVDQSYSTTIADDGGIALIDSSNNIVDQVGMCDLTTYKEFNPSSPAFLSPLSGNANQSYERKTGGSYGNCFDTDDNSVDFILNPSSSNPQNSTSAPIVCISVTNVTSMTADGVYTSVDPPIDVRITFSDIVTVTGSPTLLLETGLTDRYAVYSGGSGSNTLTFTYTIAAGDTSSDLDYVATDSLALNGGTIKGGIDAILALPSPGAAYSLGANKAIEIDNDVDPDIFSFTRQAPNTSPTNSDTLIFRATFNEAVNGVDTADFAVNSATTALVSDVTGSGYVYDVTISGGDLANFNGVVGLDFAALPSITDRYGHSFVKAEPATDEVYSVDNIFPAVTIDQAAGQVDPAIGLPVNFIVVFSEPVNVSAFTLADLTQSGTATGIAWDIVDSGDHMNFTLSAPAVTGSGTLIPSIDAGRVTDVAGNNNTASTSTDNTVTFAPAFAPLSVLINEVAWAGTSSTKTDDEWIEIYNPGISPVDLNGWVLKVDDGTTETPLVSFSAGDTIPTGGFLLLVHLVSGNCSDTPPNIDIFTDVVEDKCFSGSLVNGGVVLRLYDSLGTSIDTANLGKTSGWYAGSSSTYASMERRGRVLDGQSAWFTFSGTPFAHNRDGVLVKGTPKRANWATTVTPTPSRTATPARTPTKRPTAKPVGRMVINEFLPRPGFDWNLDSSIDVFDEFIEIINLGPVDVNLSGWKLDDEANLGSSPFSLPDVTLKPGERLVFYGLDTNILLSDGGDTVRLLNSSGAIIDAHTYSIAKAADQSWCRLPDGRGSWFDDCLPTPNQFNTREGEVPSMPPGVGLNPPICGLPDTLPTDFLIAECNGYGANIWRSQYWDETGWQGDLYVPENNSKWDSYVE
jgi:hypothetical protein